MRVAPPEVQFHGTSPRRDGCGHLGVEVTERLADGRVRVLAWCAQEQPEVVVVLGERSHAYGLRLLSRSAP